MTSAPWTAAILLALTTLSALPALAADEDDDGNCGVKLVLKNPDLQAQSDGFIHASGWFFIQFQAVGPGAEAVKSFTFSFGKPIEGQERCDVGGQHVTGAYLMNYRGDYTPEDGFFVPINTTLVPDDTYGAAVHAYDQANAQGREIGRFYAKALVDNDCAQPQCRDRTAAQIREKDKVMPWPRVLPGDGKQTNTDVQGMTIEFAEGVKEVRAFINGNETPLEPWAGVAMDDDAQPGNDNTPCGSQPEQLCKKRVWGPAFKAAVMPGQNDILRVSAVDLNNNRVEKIIHLLDPNQGGIVAGDDVNVDITVDQTKLTVGPGQQARFVFTLTSLSSTDAHVNLPATFDEERLDGGFSPNHVVVPPGGRTTASLILTPKQGVSSGEFPVKAEPNWRSQGQDVSKPFDLTLIVGKGGPVATVPVNETGNASAAAAKDDDKGIPSIGLVASCGIVAASAFLWRRRRV